MLRINSYQKLSKHQQSGFTFVEIVVALAIVAIMVAMATAFIGPNKKGDLKNHAYKLLGQLEIAHEESIIRGVEFGLRVEDDGYQFLIYNQEKWEPLEEHQFLKGQEFDEPFALFVNVDGQESLLQNASPESASSKSDGEQEESELEEAKPIKPPQIYMLSSGELNDFYLTIGLDESDGYFYRIGGNYLGDFKISKSIIQGDYQSDWDKDLDKEDFYAEQK